MTDQGSTPLSGWLPIVLAHADPAAFKFSASWFIQLPLPLYCFTAALWTTIALLLLVRRKCPLRLYFLTGALLLAVYFALAVLVPSYTFDYKGPLNAFGFTTSASIPAISAVTLICAIPPYKVWRFFQPVVALFAAEHFILVAIWIS